jgi:hypothetical protein
MIAHPECSILATEGIIIGSSGKRIKNIRVDFRGLPQREYLLNFGSPIVHSSVMYSREKILELGGYNEDYPIGQDYELWLKAVCSGCDISVLKRKLISLRHHPLSISNQKKEAHYIGIIIKMIYRSKSLGLDITKGEAERLVKEEPLVQKYIRHALAKRKIKSIADHIISGDIITGMSLFLRSIPSIPYAWKKMELLPIVDLLLNRIV